MTKSRPTKDLKKHTEPDKSAPPDGGWRETVESVAMAVVLALLFRGFVAEAFVIPTGSMAPTLDGRHKDLKCPKCGESYQVSCSPEQEYDVLTGRHVVNGTCPVCRFTQRLNSRSHPNEGSFSGDRIIVGKFAYDLMEPKRWDVIVFKFPGGAATNYIKRLIGLPGEKVWIVGGNIYTCGNDEPETALRIARKPPAKLSALLQIVDDTDHIPPELTKLGWPSRWQSWPANKEESATWKALDGGRAFTIDGLSSGDAWLRYRNIVPHYDDWRYIEENDRLPPDVGQRPGELITDLYAYNTAAREQAVSSPVVPFWQWPMPKGYRPPAEIQPSGPLGDPPTASTLGEHWVDDLAVECLAEVTGNQGELALMLVRGGVQHICRINLADGKASMSMSDSSGQPRAFESDDGQNTENPTAQTSLKGPGRYRLRLSNCDHEMLLWVNGSVAAFSGPTTYRSADLVAPYFSAAEPGDAAPAGIASRGAAMKLSQLRILRDKYYIATDDQVSDAEYPYQNDTNDYSERVIVAGQPTLHEDEALRYVFTKPSLWASSNAFQKDNRRHVQFVLDEDQFLPMGDNSPQSSDARFWVTRRSDGEREEHHYVERDLLIGKALIIYWPHTWNTPIPFLPKFSRMGPIR
jgi:signal peptidase I